MSKYLILLILNLPFVMLGIVGALTQYKMQRIGKSSFWIRISLWLLILVGLLSAENLYNWLYAYRLTDADPLSLFDVVQITAIIVLFYVAHQIQSRLELAEKRLNLVHQEISIKFSSLSSKDKP